MMSQRALMSRCCLLYWKFQQSRKAKPLVTGSPAHSSPVHRLTDSQLTDSLTQTGQRHGGQMDGLHGVGPLVQRPHELEVEDAADQAADAAGGEENHLKGATKGQTDRRGQSEQGCYQLHPTSVAPAGLTSPPPRHTHQKKRPENKNCSSLTGTQEK